MDKSLFESLADIARTGNESWRTLPPETYDSDEIFELEKERIFKPGWICIGRADQVANPGDYLTVDVVGEPVLMLRDKDNKIRVLSNVCRHRWMKLCEGQGHCDLLVCPYHSWTYNLDGTLRGAPEMKKTPGFEADTVRLPEIRHEIWQGFVYINLDGEAESLLPRLTKLDEKVAEFNLPDWRVATTVDCGEYPWDWKVMQDNGECYHHLGAHLESFEVNFPARQVTTECSDDWIFQVSPCTPESRRDFSGELFAPGNFNPVPGLKPWQQSCFILIYVLPNFFIYVQPDMGINMRIFPTAAGKFRMSSDLYFPPQAFETPEFPKHLENAVEFFNRFNDEDVFINTQVQQGSRSMHAQPAPLSHLEAHNRHVAWWIASKLTGT